MRSRQCRPDRATDHGHAVRGRGGARRRCLRRATTVRARHDRGASSLSPAAANAVQFAMPSVVRSAKPASVIAGCARKPSGSWGAAMVSVPHGIFRWTRGTPGLFRSSAVVRSRLLSGLRHAALDAGGWRRPYRDRHRQLDDPPELAPPTSQVGIESSLPSLRSLVASLYTTEDSRSPGSRPLTSLAASGTIPIEWPPPAGGRQRSSRPAGGQGRFHPVRTCCPIPTAFLPTERGDWTGISQTAVGAHH